MAIHFQLFNGQTPNGCLTRTGIHGNLYGITLALDLGPRSGPTIVATINWSPSQFGEGTSDLFVIEALLSHEFSTC